jgi:hypothetical protein
VKAKWRGVLPSVRGSGRFPHCPAYEEAGETHELPVDFSCTEIMCLSNCKSLAGKGLCLRRRSRLTRGGFSEQG